MKHDRDFYITENFTKDEYELLPVGEEITKTSNIKVYKEINNIKVYDNINTFQCMVQHQIKKYKHKDNILVLYSSWIVDGTGSTTALFTGSYDNLQESKNYSWNNNGKSLVYFDKIVKEEINGHIFYYCNWLDIETNKLSYKTTSEKEAYDKQPYVREQKLNRITNGIRKFR